jgi:hypothetical protein
MYFIPFRKRVGRMNRATCKHRDCLHVCCLGSTETRVERIEEVAAPIALTQGRSQWPHGSLNITLVINGFAALQQTNQECFLE